MLEKFLNIFRIPDLRKRVLFTAFILAVYRLGAWIPTPGVNTHQLEIMFNQQTGSMFGLMDLFSGGTLRRMTIFALGIMPYITASIIFQLLTVVYEPLARIQKEGELGRRKITQWTRYMTVVLGALQSIGIAAILTKTGTGARSGAEIHSAHRSHAHGGHRLHHVAGRTDYRSRHRQRHEPADLYRHCGRPAPRRSRSGPEGPDRSLGADVVRGSAALVAGMAAVVAFIVFVERSERRIPIQSARRIVGRRMMGGQSSHLPLKVNSGGVMPIIFASSILSAPLLFGQVDWVQNNRFLQPILLALTPGYPWYELLNILAIIFFAYFYVSIVMRPDDIADNFRKSGSFIPGIRPGKRTSDFINDILTRITLVGALYLIVVQMIPTFLLSGIRFDKIWLIGGAFENLPNWMIHGMNVNFYFGGTSLLIVVGVAMDTVNQIESQLIMRHYDGFSPRSGRIRGRKTW